MRTAFRRRLVIATAAFLIAGLAIGVLSSRKFQGLCCAREWRRYRQPDGDHTIVVYRIPQWFGMPGQASDAPGIVKLVDAHGGIEQTVDIDMVQDVSDPEWSPGRVHIKLIADWPVGTSR
jgi:hypothetical protein